MRRELVLVYLYSLDGSACAIDAGDASVQEDLLRFAAEHGRPWTTLTEPAVSGVRLLRFGRAIRTDEGSASMLVERTEPDSRPYQAVASFTRYYGSWGLRDSTKRVPPLAGEALGLLDAESH